MEFSFAHKAWSRGRQGSRPGRWPFSKIPAMDVGTWVPSVLLLWHSIRVHLACVVQADASVPQLCSDPQEGEQVVSWTHLTAGG